MLGFISGISPLGMVVILIIALVVFGNRLPEVARSMGRAMNEFKRGLKDVDEDVKREPESKRSDSARELHAPPEPDSQQTVERTGEQHQH